MKDIIVYDFDKTLTYKDTLFDFLKYCSKKDFYYPIKLIIYMIAMLLSKIGFISNTTMKELGVRLFLEGMDKEEFLKKSKEYSKSIVTNKLYNEVIDKKEKCFILTGSFEDYIKPLFGDFVTILGSNISFKNDKVDKLGINIYKDKKIQILQKVGIKGVDRFYTDSFSDFEVAKISKRVFIVKGDEIKECKNLDDFCSYFGYEIESNTKNIKIGKVKLMFVRV